MHGNAAMSLPAERAVDVGGRRCRGWDKGEASAVGLPHRYVDGTSRTPFHGALAARRYLAVPSPAGFRVGDSFSAAGACAQ